MGWKSNLVIGLTSLVVAGSAIGGSVAYNNNDNFRATINETFNINDKKQNEIDELNNRYVLDVDDLVLKTEQLEQANANLVSLTAEKETLTTALTEATEELEIAQTQLETKQSELESLTAEKTALETSLADAEINVTNLTNQLAEVNESLEITTTENEELQALKTELETQLAEEQNKVTSLTSQLETATASLEEKEAVLTSLNAQIETLTNEKTQLEEDVAEKESEIETLTAHIEDLVAKINNLENLVVEDYEKYNDVISSSTAYYTYMLPNGNMVLSKSGVYLYDFYDGTFTQIINDSNAYTTFIFNEEYQQLLCLGSSSQYVYDLTTKLVTSVGTNSMSILDYVNFSNGNVLFNTKTTYGYYLFKFSDDSLNFLSNSHSDQYKTFIKGYYDDIVFVTSNSSGGSKGLFMYDNTTETTTQVHSYGCDWDFCQFQLTNGNLILTSNTYSSILYFDAETKTCIEKSVSSVGFGNFFETPTGHVILTNTYSSSVTYLYIFDLNNLSNILTKVSVSGSLYDTFTEDENGVKITISTSSDPEAYAMYFNYSTLECTSLT